MEDECSRQRQKLSMRGFVRRTAHTMPDAAHKTPPHRKLLPLRENTPSSIRAQPVHYSWHPLYRYVKHTHTCNTTIHKLVHIPWARSPRSVVTIVRTPHGLLPHPMHLTLTVGSPRRSHNHGDAHMRSEHRTRTHVSYTCGIRTGFDAPSWLSEPSPNPYHMRVANARINRRVAPAVHLMPCSSLSRSEECTFIMLFR